MLCNQKGKVCIICLFLVSFIAVSIYRDDSVSIFIYNNSVWIHTECTYIIFEFFCSIYDFAFVKFICQMWEYNSRKLYSNTDIYTVGFCRDFQILTCLFHPFTSASSYRYNTFFTFITAFFTYNFVAIFNLFNCVYRCIKIEIHMVFHLIIQILKYHIVDICSKMTNRCIQKI